MMRWIEGAGLTLGPVLLLAGVLLRAGEQDFFPGQLAAYAAEPGRMTLSYSLFTAGVVLLCPAAVAVGRRVAGVRPGWAAWGVALVVVGLFGRAFHAGVSHLAFQLVDALGPAAARDVVAATYGAFHVFKAASVCIVAGWPVLAFGAWRAGVLGPVRAVALAAGSALPLGVLKGSSDPVSLAALAGPAVALVPLGLSVLRGGPAPKWWAAALTVAFVPFAYVLGNLG